MLVQEVKRNLNRFPEDFMFPLSAESLQTEITEWDIKFVPWLSNSMDLWRIGTGLI